MGGAEAPMIAQKARFAVYTEFASVCPAWSTTIVQGEQSVRTTSVSLEPNMGAKLPMIVPKERSVRTTSVSATVVEQYRHGRAKTPISAQKVRCAKKRTIRGIPLKLASLRNAKSVSVAW